MRRRGCRFSGHGFVGAHTEISLLAGELADYVAAFERGAVDWRVLWSESGKRCPRCRSASCARFCGWRYRKRIEDLSTGEVFDGVAICRVAFCDETTTSLMPAELWRGRATVSSVLESVVHVLGEGVERAWEWTRAARRGGPVVSRRTLRRWARIVEQRWMGGVMSWLGARRDVFSPEPTDGADQLASVLDHLDPQDLLAFRSTFGRAALDKAPPPPAARAPDCPVRRIPARLDETRPHETPRLRRPRGSWSSRSPRAPPRGPKGGAER